MKSSFLAIVASLLAMPLVHAQNWHAYAPPRAGFSVNTPAPLRAVASFEGEHGASLEPDQKFEWAPCYASIETTPEESRFGVIVINRRARAEALRSQKREEYIEYLSWVFFADDDETQFLREPVAIKHDGLKGGEYLYIKESIYGGNLYTRGRIFDTANKTYVLVFVGRTVKDLTSPDAEHFFKSFHLHGRATRT